MVGGSNTNDILLMSMEQAQKWVDDALEDKTLSESPEERIEYFKKLYLAALNAIAESARTGSTQLLRQQ